MINESMSIMRDGEQDYLPIPLPGAEGVSETGHAFPQGF